MALGLPDDVSLGGLSPISGALISAAIGPSERCDFLLPENHIDVADSLMQHIAEKSEKCDRSSLLLKSME
ncbi:hypothetical protein ACJ73_02651 [Blastomyces percursus]|uniref:Uncharacterized protein n=1 Tax=Blastomyces percursus TaxID=1658174 RepID=A0A1J9QD07_9EURO|nr:hypothetical protein ACJ73_02651 [Blastomyces percursus]